MQEGKERPYEALQQRNTPLSESINGIILESYLVTWHSQIQREASSQ